MKSLILVRHGETVWNSLHRYQGHTDIPLNENGILQAELLADKLKNTNLDTIFSSDLIRAKRTAEIIAKYHNLEVCTSPLLREICFGQWEGLNYSQIKDKYPDLLEVWLKKPVDLRIPDGETFVELHERVSSFIRTITPLYKNKSVMIVAHGGTIAAIICYLLGIDIKKMWDYKIDNTAITTFKMNNNTLILENHNDSSHLINQIG